MSAAFPSVAAEDKLDINYTSQYQVSTVADILISIIGCNTNEQNTLPGWL